MKKIFSALLLLLMAGNLVTAQTDVDKKYRFGLRITPQPSWFVSGDKNLTPAGPIMGFGFGLNMEYKISETAVLLTGIGGDFEGGKYRFKHDAGYSVSYWMDDADEMVTPSQDKKTKSIVYELKERRINTTFVTIPFILKLITKEYSGLKYFGLFGAELGVRLKSEAKDTYWRTLKYNTDTTYVVLSDETTATAIPVGEEASQVPARLGFNVGAGAEYRLGGSTSLFASVSFFRGLTRYTRKESDFLIYRTDRTSGKESYKMVKQNLFLSLVRINIGIMF